MAMRADDRQVGDLGIERAGDRTGRGIGGEQAVGRQGKRMHGDLLVRRLPPCANAGNGLFQTHVDPCRNRPAAGLVC